MGRQIHFYMFGDDCATFVTAVQACGPFVVARRDAMSSHVEPLVKPCVELDTLVLWNQELLPSVERRYVARSVKPYYRFPDDAPALEFSPSGTIGDWDGRPAMSAGRIYAGSYQEHPRLARWYEGIARWLRRHFLAHRIADSVAYAGPEAWEWHQNGGLLLPMVRPLVTPAWRDILGVASITKVPSGHDA